MNLKFQIKLNVFDMKYSLRRWSCWYRTYTIYFFPLNILISLIKTNNIDKQKKIRHLDQSMGIFSSYHRFYALLNCRDDSLCDKAIFWGTSAYSGINKKNNRYHYNLVNQCSMWCLDSGLNVRTINNLEL